MKKIETINFIMNTIPKNWQYRWCGGEYGACACVGCVQIGNRIIMWEQTTKRQFFGDPEHIDEKQIPKNIYSKYKITKQEWEEWKERNK